MLCFSAQACCIGGLHCTHLLLRIACQCRAMCLQLCPQDAGRGYFGSATHHTCIVCLNCCCHISAHVEPRVSPSWCRCLPPPACSDSAWHHTLLASDGQPCSTHPVVPHGLILGGKHQVRCVVDNLRQSHTSLFDFRSDQDQ